MSDNITLGSIYLLEWAYILNHSPALMEKEEESRPLKSHTLCVRHMSYHAHTHGSYATLTDLSGPFAAQRLSLVRPRKPRKVDMPLAESI